jgi:2-keto-4-pentenoate hydratase
MTPELEQLGELLCHSRRAGIRFPISSFEPLTAEDAYAVQDYVADKMKWFVSKRRTAWKIGGAPGSLITFAPVPAHDIHASGWHPDGGYSVGYGIEGELAVQLTHDLDGTADRERIIAAIGAWLPCIELCDSRFEPVDQTGSMLRLADQQWNRALVLGTAVTLDRLPDWSDQSMSVSVNGKQALVKRGSHPFNDPLATLSKLAAHAERYGHGLRAGDVIATGSWCGVIWADPGELIDVEFAGVGTVSLTIPPR